MTIAHDRAISQPLLLDVSNTALQVSPEQLEQLRHNNPALKLELLEDGKLVVESKEVSRSDRYEFGELTPEEIAQRVAKIERFTEWKRQLWDSLNSEEKAEHDRQFESLYQEIEESRR
jgi:hypothetical protein